MATGLPRAVDVLVVGGGPAGLATAIAARRHGLIVVVADGAVPPIDKACGEGLMPDGVEALRQLGIAIPEADAYAFRGIRFLSDGVKVEAEFPRGTAYGVRRTHLHCLLLGHAAACGVQMLWKAVVTGLHPEGALVGGELLRARWVVGADGSASRVRRWMNADRPDPARAEKKPRIAFRRHYRVAPWSAFMELYWGRECQIYVTPTGREEVCVALIGSGEKLRLEAALGEFPQLLAHLKAAKYASSERGAITATRSVRRVYRGRTVLVGDASGGVDAITGEGLCLAFRQAALLGGCLAGSDLARYQEGHHALLRRPATMARLMLLMARHGWVRRSAMRMFQSSPRVFAAMLAMHVGDVGQPERDRHRQFLPSGVGSLGA